MESIENKLLKEIHDLEYQINNIDLVNKNIKLKRKKELRKSYIKRIVIPFSVTLVTTMLAGSIISKDIPLYCEGEKTYPVTKYLFIQDEEFVRKTEEITTNPNLQSELTYFGPSIIYDNDLLQREIISLKGIIKEDPDISRLLKDKNYLKSLFTFVEEETGIYIADVNKENEYLDSVIYYVNQDNYVINKTKLINEILYLVVDISIASLIFTIIYYYVLKLYDKRQKDIDTIEEESKELEIEDLKRKLKIRTSNYERLVK